MCLKRYINRLSLIQLTLKGMGILYIVPVVFLFLVLPFLTYLDFAKGYSPEQCYFSTYIMLQIFCKFSMKFFLISKKCFTFALAKQKRNVAQLVAHYVRDVGVGRSSRLIPTEKT